MLNYNPGNFAAEYETPLGHDLWRFLNESPTVIRLKTATALGRPAVEGIEEELLERFKDDIENLVADRDKQNNRVADRNRQMIGHMVRQIMESDGYVIDMQNVKITNGAPFTRATRYKLVDDMTFHVFTDGTDFRSVALTADRAGSRLPKDKKWLYWKSFKGGLRGRIAFGVSDEKQARADIMEHGYYLYRRERMLRKV